MPTAWQVQEVGEVEVDRRNLKMQAAQAIRSVLDGLVELITNSDDAYVRTKNTGKILIEVTRRRGAIAAEIVVKDRAGGMTVDEMKQRILRYGGFSAGREARGYMGRGAKDIVALGKATFESMKDGRVHRVEINGEFETQIMKPRRATAEDLQAFGVRKRKGGTRVTLTVRKSHRFKVPQHETLCRELQRHHALREVLQRREVRLVDTNARKSTPLCYEPPEGEVVWKDELVFQAPYEGARAELGLCLAPEELAVSLNEGVYVCDDAAVHQVTRFAPELDQDPFGRRFFGRLSCPYIRKLQIEFETCRHKGERPPKHNPVDIVDPNRRLGLDREHPFVKRLFGWAEERLRLLVEELREKEGEARKAVANPDTRKRLRALGKAVAEHLRSRLDEEQLAPSTQDDDGVLRTEGAVLNPPFSRIAVGQLRRMGYTVVSFGEEEDPKAVSVEVQGKGIAVRPSKPPLRPQRRNAERLSAYFDVEGTEPAEQVTLVVHIEHPLISPLERQLEVVAASDPFADLPFGLNFEKARYGVHHNGTRTVAFVAKGRRFRSVDWSPTTLVRSAAPEAVAVLGGGTVTVESPAPDLWRGTLRVRGRGIGKQSELRLTVRTSSGRVKATTTVRVVEREDPPGIPIEIVLVPESGGRRRAAWDTERPTRLQVFAKHPTLVRYLGAEKDGYPGQEKPTFRVLLAEIVAECVVQRILEDRVRIDPQLPKNMSLWFGTYEEELSEFLPIAHRVMIPDGVARTFLKA